MRSVFWQLNYNIPIYLQVFGALVCKNGKYHAVADFCCCGEIRKSNLAFYQENRNQMVKAVVAVVQLN